MRSATLDILVVDDTEEYLVSLAAILKDEHFNVRTAAGGREALEKLKESKADIVLMDVEMPRIDGIETLRKIRMLYPKEWLPVILMSAKSSIGDQLHGYSAGCDEFLAKPTDPRLLLAKIKVFQRILRHYQTDHADV